ncbi:MAG: DUF971 domain-containing protein [Rhizobiaceae bacterium]
MAQLNPKIWPTEIRLRNEGRTLRVSFETGDTFDLDAEYLRVESPSAEVQGHSPDQRKWIGGKRNVRIKDMHAVGNYAVQLDFDDGHTTGIYPWEVLFHLGSFKAEIWAIYETKIAEKGLSRDA